LGRRHERYVLIWRGTGTIFGCRALAEPDQSAPARCSEALAEEIADFIARRVLEQDAQFFDG
jgi:hypothetical protein